MRGRKVVLLILALSAVLAVGQRQIDAQGESGVSLQVNGDAPYWPSLILSLYAVVPDECVGDTLTNEVRDVAGVMFTAGQSQCQVYLPLVAAHWREPWPTVTSTH